MRYVAAYLLAVMSGNESPSNPDLKKILGSVGVDFDEAKAKKVVDSLKGKKCDELIVKGHEKLASVPAASAAAAPAAAAAAPAAAKAAEPKKEEKKKEEKKEESDDEDMGFGLFD